VANQVDMTPGTERQPQRGTGSGEWTSGKDTMSKLDFKSAFGSKANGYTVFPPVFLFS
jgi:hypothetical protein